MLVRPAAVLPWSPGKCVILPSERECRFGRWYYGEGNRDLQKLDCFQQIERPHAAVHAQGQAALDAYQQRALEALLEHLGRMEEANLEVMRIVEAVVAQFEAGRSLA